MKTAIQEAIVDLREMGLLSAAIILEERYLRYEELLIKAAYAKGVINMCDRAVDGEGYVKSADDYYKETYTQ